MLIYKKKKYFINLSFVLDKILLTPHDDAFDAVWILMNKLFILQADLSSLPHDIKNIEEKAPSWRC